MARYSAASKILESSEQPSRADLSHTCFSFCLQIPEHCCWWTWQSYRSLQKLTSILPQLRGMGSDFSLCWGKEGKNKYKCVSSPGRRWLGVNNCHSRRQGAQVHASFNRRWNELHGQWPRWIKYFSLSFPLSPIWHLSPFIKLFYLTSKMVLFNPKHEFHT